MATRYLTATEAAAHMRCPTVSALHSFLYRRRRAGFPVTTRRRGRVLLFLESDLDEAISVEQSRNVRLRRPA